MGEMIKMVVVLTVLSVISGGGLKWYEGFTKPAIENAEMQLVKGPTVLQIMEGAENNPIEQRFKIPSGETEQTIFVGKFDGQLKTIAMETQVNGFADKMGLMVAINTDDDTLKGIGVTTHKETPGLGGNAKADPSFAAQFKGKTIDQEIKVTNDGGDINAISGATITSRAVCKGTMQAIEAYKQLKPQILEQLKSLEK
ncbi:RnfABCDGE type electron transport complex subunit G [Desulfatitalea tepidiphila]|uniref:RnfABCDGE type electron transport complex subunit G n=1 Tax=Desulfatitalea tepidiphila TaxID=1185843 RepID=UPI0006B5E30B|nr:RnfABCDGE type electron transport complex subunit G [Desulfatitalea tepidiphila]